MGSPSALVSAVTLAVALTADDFTGDEISLLASIFFQLADTLTTYSLMRQRQDKAPGTDAQSTERPQPT